MKKLIKLSILLIGLSLMMTGNVYADKKINPEKDEMDVIIIDKQIETPTGAAGDKVDVTIPLKNLSDSKLKNVIITAQMSSNVDEYPFQITKTNSYKKLGTIDPDETVEAAFTNRKIREEASAGYHEVKYKITYTRDGDAYEVERSIFILVKESEEEEEEPTPEEEPETGDDDLGDGSDAYDDGDYYSGTDVTDSSDSDGDASKGTTPRVIIEKFTTDPETVNAGDTFKIILNLRNTSKLTAVSNMILTFQSPGSSDSSSTADTSEDAFLPVNGSDTIFVESIGKDTTKEVSIEMTARSDLSQRTYPMEIALKYEDASANAYEESLNISVAVHQQARFELSSISVSPSTIEVGEESNLTFQIYNLGKTRLYNVSIAVDDPSIAEGQQFVGNIDTGGTGSVDMMVSGAEVSTGDGTCRLLVTYEDQDGNEATYETSCNLLVEEAAEFEDDLLADVDEYEEDIENDGHGIVFWAGIAVAVAVVLLLIVWLIRRKRRKEREWADEILGSDGDELR